MTSPGTNDNNGIRFILVLFRSAFSEVAPVNNAIVCTLALINSEVLFKLGPEALEAGNMALMGDATISGMVLSSSGLNPYT